MSGLDHTIIFAALLILLVGGQKLKRLRDFLLPFLLTIIIYDSQRFYGDYIRGPIHVAEPYNFDKYFFGIKTAQGLLTPNEWWQLHLHPTLDLITGFFYLTFVPIYMTISGYFFFFLSRKGTKKVSAAEISRQVPRTMWAFFFVNILGYTTYYWYAAAPPWYVAAYGLGPANLNVQASAAGCLRFDAILGTNFFTEMYGRAADVFGAIPSLHVAYPLLSIYYAFRFGSLRIFTVFFYVIMCFSAVYLNHHYILDIIWGSAYALITGLAIDFALSLPHRFAINNAENLIKNRDSVINRTLIDGE